jgi:hypothetical protein
MSELHICFEVVRDDGAYEAPNERVVVLRPLGSMNGVDDTLIYAYGAGERGRFKPGDRFDLVRRPAKAQEGRA